MLPFWEVPEKEQLRHVAPSFKEGACTFSRHHNNLDRIYPAAALAPLHNDKSSRAKPSHKKRERRLRLWF